MMDFFLFHPLKGPLFPQAARQSLLVLALLACSAKVGAVGPVHDEVLTHLGLKHEQLAELADGEPITMALHEDSTLELAVGLVWYFPVPVQKVAERLRQDDPAVLDYDVSVHGEMAESKGANLFASLKLSDEEAQALLEAGPGDSHNFSSAEWAKFHDLKGVPTKGALAEAEHRYREVLFQRFLAYRKGGVAGVLDFERGADSPASKPGQELVLAAKETGFIHHYFPALQQAWLHYPHTALPKGVEERYLWVNKEVENRPAAILRHRIALDWEGGLITLTREFYASHSYNSSQWLTSALPWKEGTVVFQQVRSFTDQVGGAGYEAKHLIGREILKERMVKTFGALRKSLVEGP